MFHGIGRAASVQQTTLHWKLSRMEGNNEIFYVIYFRVISFENILKKVDFFTFLSWGAHFSGE